MRPSPERHYQGESGRQYHIAKRFVPNVAVPWVCQLRAEKIQKHVHATDVVLEFGVGFGWNLASLKCAKKIGIDVAEDLEEHARAFGIEFQTQMRSLGDATADVIVCHHALEHVLHPGAVLAELGRLLRPGGQLLLFVPFEKERRYRRFDPLEPNHHLYSWNAQTIGNLLREAGYTLQSLRLAKFRFDRFAAVWAARLGLGERGFRLIRALGLILFPEYEIRAVAQKPNDFALAS